MKTTLSVCFVIALAACGGGNVSTIPPAGGATTAQTKSAQPSHMRPNTTSNLVVYGPIVAKFLGGFTIKTGTSCPFGGYLHVYTSPTTAISTATSVGTKVIVTGTGSCASAIAATKITPLGTPGTSMLHVLTADYLGGLYGTRAVSWTTAAPYLSWAETTWKDADAISDAGIKTMLYVDPNRTSTGSALANADETTYAHDCSNARISDVYDGTLKEYVMEISSPTLRALFARWIDTQTSHGHFDAIFEDAAGPLSEFATYTPFSGMPCDYTNNAWLSAGTGLNQSSPLPVLFNGLDGLNAGGPSLSIGLLASGMTIGGTYEGCYTSQQQLKEDDWLWQAVENSEIQVGAKGRIFDCMTRYTAAASEETNARLYDYASFLLTYSPATSMYWTYYSTPSGLHVLPETGLVALLPSGSAPASVASLKQPGGTYARQYGACYVRGVPVGKCAVVVNSDTGTSHPFPFAGYTHTLVLSGSGVADGGTISTAGSAPPAELGPVQAAIVFP